MKSEHENQDFSHIFSHMGRETMFVWFTDMLHFCQSADLPKELVDVVNLLQCNKSHHGTCGCMFRVRLSPLFMLEQENSQLFRYARNSTYLWHEVGLSHILAKCSSVVQCLESCLEGSDQMQEACGSRNLILLDSLWDTGDVILLFWLLEN